MEIEQNGFWKSRQATTYNLEIEVNDKEVSIGIFTMWDEMSVLPDDIQYEILRGGEKLTKAEKKAIDTYVNELDLNDSE